MARPSVPLALALLLALGCRNPQGVNTAPGLAPRCAGGVCVEVIHFGTFEAHAPHRRPRESGGGPVRYRELSLMAALAAASGCASTYRARQAPLGDPGWPAAHADGVRPSDAYQTPGWYQSSGEDARSATVTRDRGFEVNGYATPIDEDVRWDIRLQGGDGTDVLAMMWTPPTAPRCQGGHPALAILLDLDAPPNHVLAPDRQVRWERPVVVRGERVVAGRFDEDPELLPRESVVDLRVVRDLGRHRARGLRARARQGSRRQVLEMEVGAIC